MQKNILFGIVGLLIGLMIGFFAANRINRDALSQPSITQQTNSDAPFLNQQVQTTTVKEQHAQGGMIPAVTETLAKAKNEPNNFEAQTAAGEMYLRIQNFDKAAEFYQRANQIKPADYQTTVKIGNIYFDSGQYEQAEKWYLKALEVKPNDVNVRTDLGITFVERQTPDLDRAVKEFQTSLATNPKHEPTLYNLGVAYFKKGDVEKAEDALNHLDAINSQSELAKRLRQLIEAK
jgi:tetratricopeptide (TPR) repeat protein